MFGFKKYLFALVLFAGSLGAAPLIDVISTAIKVACEGDIFDCMIVRSEFDDGIFL